MDEQISLDKCIKRIRILLISENLYDRNNELVKILSTGEFVLKNFRSLIEGIENYIILIDDILALFDKEHNLIIFKEILKLSTKNQVIMTSTGLQEQLEDLWFSNYSHKYDVFNLPNAQNLYRNYTSIDIFEKEKSKSYSEFKKSLKTIEHLMKLEIKENSLKGNLFQLLFANVITTLETYLESVFINRVRNDNECIQKLLHNVKEFSEKKYKLGEAYKWIENLEKNIVRNLQDITFHNLWKVNSMYKEVLNIELPDIGNLIQSVLIRHDIVHRNGKNQEGKKWVINRKQLEDLITEVRAFTKKIEMELNNI